MPEFLERSQANCIAIIDGTNEQPHISLAEFQLESFCDHMSANNTIILCTRIDFLLADRCLMNMTPRTLLPITTAGWETVLVENFLQIGSDGDASPIRSFELTAETLALASRVTGSTPKEAEAAFKFAVLADVYLWGALRDGRYRPATDEQPSCLVYLAMTLLIDTLLDGNYSARANFATVCEVGWERSEASCSSLASRKCGEHSPHGSIKEPTRVTRFGALCCRRLDPDPDRLHTPPVISNARRRAISESCHGWV